MKAKGRRQKARRLRLASGATRRLRRAAPFPTQRWDGPSRPKAEGRIQNSSLCIMHSALEGPAACCNSARPNCGWYKSVQVSTSEYNQIKNLRSPSMQEHLPLTENRQGQNMGAGKSPVRIFLPPSFCLSGPGAGCKTPIRPDPAKKHKTP